MVGDCSVDFAAVLGVSSLVLKLVEPVAEGLLGTTTAALEIVCVAMAKTKTIATDLTKDLIIIMIV